MKARLSQKIKGGLACFVFLLFFFSSTFTFFFASLDKEDLNPHICDFCLARRLGEDKGGMYQGRAEASFISIFSPEIFCLALASFFILFFHFFIIL